MGFDSLSPTMDIETAFRKYHSNMQLHITFFCGDETTAKDAVSQAFTSAWLNKITLEQMPEPAMKAWLYAAARNSAIDIKRKEKRLTALPDYDLPDDGKWDPSNRIMVEKLMAVLPPELSIPIHMKYMQGYNSTEIGKIMNLPAATVRTRLKKALKIMREHL